MRKMSMQKFLLAGASSIYGIPEIKEALRRINVSSLFIEREGMCSTLSPDERNAIHLSEEIPKEDFDAIIPLNEYWVTKAAEASAQNISSKAVKASRSKEFLFKCLEEAGLDACKAHTVDEVLFSDFADSDWIIKPEGYYSGHGVAVVKRGCIEELKKHAENIRKIKLNDFVDVRAATPLCFPYIQGPEFSADIFFYRGTIRVVRMCEKIICLIGDAPCTVAYRIFSPPNDFIHASEAWMHALFNIQDISFAQFDFIHEEETDRIIPVDFSCRIGGGIKNLLKVMGRNVYASAMASAVKQGVPPEPLTEFCQFNVISTVEGCVICDDYDRLVEGEVHKIRKFGDKVGTGKSSANERLAEIITEPFDDDAFRSVAYKMTVGEEYVQ